MDTIKKYLTTNKINFNAMKEKNEARMQELMKLSQEMQTEYNNLDNSNKFLQDLITDINNEFEQEGENNGTEKNIQST